MLKMISHHKFIQDTYGVIIVGIHGPADSHPFILYPVQDLKVNLDLYDETNTTKSKQYLKCLVFLAPTNKLNIFSLVASMPGSACVSMGIWIL